MQHFAEPQPTGTPLPQWQPPPSPSLPTTAGRYCRLEPLRPDLHAPGLYQALILEGSASLWTYLPAEPPPTPEAFTRFLIHRQSEASTHALVILDPDSGRPTGITSYLRIDPANGVVEIGWVLFSPLLQRTRAATEALSLQIDYAFQLGYRRVEWKCDSLNAPSRSAAERLGFQYEGTFRQAVVTKGRNRDTTWYSLIDREWPAVRAAHQRWLDPVNFLPDGRQILRLSELTHSVHTVRT